MKKEEVKEFWNIKPCGTFGDARKNPDADYFLKIKERRYRLEPFIKELIPFESLVGKKVLEIGCGVGTDGVGIARARGLYTGVDLSETSVSLAERNFSLNGVSGGIKVADSENLPFEDNVFDFVYSWGVLHHTPDTEKAVNEVHRVLKPGGKFLIMLYNRRSLVGLQLYIFYGLLRLRPWSSFLDLFAKHHESPGTKALTDREARILFRKFVNLRIRNLVTPYDMRITRNLFLPLFMGIFIPSKLGFFKIIEGEKK